MTAFLSNILIVMENFKIAFFMVKIQFMMISSAEDCFWLSFPQSSQNL